MGAPSGTRQRSSSMSCCPPSPAAPPPGTPVGGGGVDFGRGAVGAVPCRATAVCPAQCIAAQCSWVVGVRAAERVWRAGEQQVGCLWCRPAAQARILSVRFSFDLIDLYASDRCTCNSSGASRCTLCMRETLGCLFSCSRDGVRGARGGGATSAAAAGRGRRSVAGVCSASPQRCRGCRGGDGNTALSRRVGRELCVHHTAAERRSGVSVP